ncbi:MAG: DUF6456 domain-containing protein [Pseudomonadota bacterium]
MNETQDVLQSCTARADAVFSGTSQAASAKDAALYLAHTERGAGIRALAEAVGTHPSTVSRAVRRVEHKRDDPLFDKMLTEAEELETPVADSANVNQVPALLRETGRVPHDELRREAKKYLRRLSEPGAFLLIAHAAEKAGIFCAANQFKRPISILSVSIAAEFMRQDWIKPRSRGSSTVKYGITDVGRAHLRRVLAEDRPQKGGFAEAASPFLNQHREMGEKLFANKETGKPEPKAVNLGESPIGWLARRKGSDGKPFLGPEEVEAAERLRCDFEAANLGPQIAQDWQRFLTPSDRLSGTPQHHGPGGGATAARDRVMAALASLGPGLADVVMRTCCFLEGLEACERRMGWSARSGKVVLQLALHRLADHYGLIVFRN